MGDWICEKCNERSASISKVCSQCGHDNSHKHTIHNKPNKQLRPTKAFTVIYIQNGKEMRNVIDGLSYESVQNKFLKCMNRLSVLDIVDVLEGEHLE